MVPLFEALPESNVRYGDKQRVKLVLPYPIREATRDHFLSRVHISKPPSSLTIRCRLYKSKERRSKFGILNDAPFIQR